MLEGKIVQIPDLADPEYTLHEAQRIGGFRTVLGVPLLREGTPIGVIILLRTTCGPFTDKQIELVTTFADQAVIAIENVRLFDEVQARTRELTESLEQQTATSEVLQVISSSPGELEPVFQAMLANATRICEAKFGICRTMASVPIGRDARPPPALAEIRQRGPFHAAEKPCSAASPRTKQCPHRRPRGETVYLEGDRLLAPGRRRRRANLSQCRCSRR